MFTESLLATVLSVFIAILAVVIVILFGKFDGVMILSRSSSAEKPGSLFYLNVA